MDFMLICITHNSKRQKNKIVNGLSMGTENFDNQLTKNAIIVQTNKKMYFQDSQYETFLATVEKESSLKEKFIKIKPK